MNWWLEAPHMLHWHVLCFTVRGFQIFVQCCKYLTVQNLNEKYKTVDRYMMYKVLHCTHLKSSNPVHHPFQLDALNILIQTINSLDSEVM